MKKLFAATAAALAMGAAMPAAAQEGAAPSANRVDADAAMLTDAHCALVGTTGPRSWICAAPSERRRLRDVYQFAVAAAHQGAAYQSVWMYLAGMSAVGGFADGKDPSAIHARLADMASTGLCAAYSKEAGIACTAEQSAALQRLMQAAYAGESIQLPDHDNSPGAAETTRQLDDLETRLAAAIAAILAPAASFVAVDAPVPSWVDLQRSFNPLEGFTPEQQDDLRLAVEDVCADWLLDSGAACSPQQEQRILRFMTDFARAGQMDVEGYRAGIAAILGRFPRNPNIAANNRAIGVVSDYCETTACGRWQRAQLIELVKTHMLAGEPATSAEAQTRQTLLREGIAAIMAQDPDVRPATLARVVLIPFGEAEPGTTTADTAARLCQSMAEENQLPCTAEKTAAITAVLNRHASLPAPVTERARRAGLRALYRDMETAFFGSAPTAAHAPRPN